MALKHPELVVLREAGWRYSGFRWEIVRAVAISIGLAVAGAYGFFPAALIGPLAPSVVMRVIASRRREERGRHTVALLQMTLAGLRSGSSLTEALRLATRSETHIEFVPFAEAVRAFDLGAPLDVTLRDARSRARDHRAILGLDALSLCVAERLPASRCVNLIASVVDRLVFEQRLADDVRARTSGVRMQIVLLAALVPGLALYLASTVPGVAETLASPLGSFVLLPLAGLLEGAGILASRRVVSSIA